MSIPFVFYGVPILLLLVTVARRLRPWVSRPKGPLPPGPKPKFLIGNLTDLPLKHSPMVYEEWGAKYNSDILYANALGNNIIILNKYEPVEELLERRSKIYSDRPHIPIFDLLDMDYNVSLMPQGDVWRRHRKVFQEHFRPEAMKKYSSIQYSKAHGMLRSLLSAPDQFMDYSRMYAISVPMAILYGYDVQSFQDPCIVAAEGAMRKGTALFLPGSTLVNVFPFMKHFPSWFPGTEFQGIAATVRELTAQMKQIPTDYVKEKFAKGESTPSVVADLLERKAAGIVSKEEEEAIMNMAYTTYGAGAESLTSSVITLIYVMAIFPEVKKKAQKELDGLLGGERLPTFEDRKSLPYIEAIYREVLRWQPPFRIGAPRLVPQDDYYKGYIIPKGSVVFTNTWTIARDEALYEKPDLFDPDRFMTEDGKINEDDRIFAYGFGRRSCSGKHAASAMLWLIIASLISTYDISKKRDKDGKEVQISDEYVEYGIIYQKAPFECSIIPRSQAARRLIEDTANTTQR